MQAHHAMPSFKCRTTCNHKECQRHAHLGIVDQHEDCKCLGEVTASSIFLENVLDLANTLAQIMVICGIHECKAKSTVDITTYAFLHYDQVCYCIDTVPKKRLRKEDLFHELGRKCLMNRVEAHLAYTIIKRGFKAFYYTPHDDNHNESAGQNSYSDECVYVHAARKTAESYARYDGLSCEEQRGYEAKIKVVYKKYYDRMHSRKTQPEGDDCNCCFCAKKRGHLIYGKEPPCGTKKKETHRCPHCCQKKKKKFVHPGRAPAKCPVCHRARRFCVCEKYKFTLNWVQSIWERPDFNLYYKEQIEDVAKREAEAAAALACLGSVDRMGSQSGSHAGSQAGSKAGSQAGSPHGSRHGSKATSKHGMASGGASEHEPKGSKASVELAPVGEIEGEAES